MEKIGGLATPFVLGVDLGTNSLGWALISLDGNKPAQLIRCGTRVFDAGMEGDIASGNEESRNKKRRQMRLQRRQTARRARRQRKIFHLLQDYGLLPDRSVPGPRALQDALNSLDTSILASPWFAAKRQSGAFKESDQVLPYILRAAALDEKLEPEYLGRALYHLAQRRGFKSNRKAPPKEDERPGEVAKGINELRDAMTKTGARTLGEYFARLDPFERRIRQRWTARGMYEDEFKRIWEAQAPHHPQTLTPERHKELYGTIFYQRPLWFSDSLVGTCELERDEPRAQKYSFLAQRFRLLQSINNLRLELPDGTERSLTTDERGILAHELEIAGDRTFAQVKKLLKLPKQARFTIERGGEKKLPGNRTTAKFYEAFGERWLEMSAAEHEEVLHDALSIQDEVALKRRAMNHWKLDEKSAENFAKFSPEPDYFNLSRKAMEKLLPLLEAGTSYAEARRQLYPEKFESRAAFDSLPRLDGEEARAMVGEIRNPAVTRSLTELRKVVNAIVRQYGKPVEIRIELARDLKRSQKERQGLTDRNRENEAAREKMKKKILEGAGLANPSGTDIRKALLWEECGGVCPYTGKPIDFRHLFGRESQFDIEHIIPFDRCFDNSFSNLTLCYHEENRNVKGRKTPWEAYHGDAARYEEILDRVKRFHSPSAHSKLWRFQMTETEATEFVSKFVSRQLNDTRYASRLAAKYVAMLYGGLSDDEHTRRVHVTSGEVTAQLRRAWKLNGILNDGPTTGGGEAQKTRDDHRHHAVDAVAIALTSNSTIQQLSRAAERASERGQRKLETLEGPWGKDLAEFVDSVREQIDKVIVSHRVSKKVSGALHEETIYSPPFKRINVKGKAVEVVHVRKKLSAITTSEIEDIVDDAVRRLVVEKLAGFAGKPDKFFSNESNLPCFVAKDGRRIPIKSVRIAKAERPTPIGQGRVRRHLMTGNNHHVEIYAECDKNGKGIGWYGAVVSMYEAYERLKGRKPVVQRECGPLEEFKFSLAKGDTIELTDDDGSRTLFAVKKLGRQISLIEISDARKITKYFSPRVNGLFSRAARKVTVTPLGDVHEAHD